MADLDNINFEDELRKIGHADPFVPFEIVVTSGDRYQVIDPYQLAIGGTTVVIMLPKVGMKFFRKNQIVAVHTLEPA